MRTFIIVLILAGFTALHAVSARAAAPANGSGPANIPFAFVENKGQAPKGVRYLGNGLAFKAWFNDGGVVFQQGSAVTRIDFKGGRAGALVVPSEPLGAHANYLRGSDPRNWQTDLPMYGTLSYREVWPGIDVRFSGPARLKTEYLVAAHASPSAIRLRVDGQAEILSDGSLSILGKSGRYREEKPTFFQEDRQRRIEVDGSFQIYPDGAVGFSIPQYNSELPLIVDPVILFSGYAGGSSQSSITGVAIDSFYNTVVAGWTASTDLPASGGARPHYAGGIDAFVASFNPAGGALNFCTYLGGSGDDRAFALALDGSNNVYITGWTSSTNFPLVGAAQSKLGGTRDAFVAKLNALGNQLVFSTYLGGSAVDVGYGIALDSTSSPVITGDTTSSNLPVTAGVFQTKLTAGQDVFIAKLSPSGSTISLLTYYGGTGTDHSAAVKVDASNLIYIGGATTSMNLPTASAAQPKSGGGQDGFYAKFSADLKTLLVGTYFGGSGGVAGAPEEINALAIGPGGNVVVGGTTSSTNLPLTSKALQLTFGGGNTDGFTARYSSAGALQFSTYLGGSSDDGINAVAVDYYGAVYAAGYTSSGDIISQNASQRGNLGGMDAFLIKHSWTKLMFATYLGGQGADCANAVAIDSMTSVVVAGTTGSPDFPAVGNVGTWPGTSLSSFVTKLAPQYSLTLAAPPVFLQDVWHDTGYNGPNVNLVAANFGTSGDIPIAGDWDGSGVRRIGVFRKGTWLLDINNNGVFDSSDKTVTFGQAGDIPVVGDWNGTGKIKLGLFRNGTFILDLSGHLAGTPTGVNDATYPFGMAGDLPIVADWNQSGTTKIGVFRNGSWLIDYDGDGAFTASDKTYVFGQAGDKPVVGDWDSSGLPRIGVFRSGTWILDYPGANVWSAAYDLNIVFGNSSYSPLIM